MICQYIKITQGQLNEKMTVVQKTSVKDAIGMHECGLENIVVVGYELVRFKH